MYSKSLLYSTVLLWLSMQKCTSRMAWLEMLKELMQQLVNLCTCVKVRWYFTGSFLKYILCSHFGGAIHGHWGAFLVIPCGTSRGSQRVQRAVISCYLSYVQVFIVIYYFKITVHSCYVSLHILLIHADMLLSDKQVQHFRI